jgi:uncharacterized membrane protein YfcA
MTGSLIVPEVGEAGIMRCMWTYVLLLPLAALITSAISGMLGMAGGMLLLATMFCFLTHAETIPTHATVQLVSNSTRLVAFARNIAWPTVGRFVAGATPGAALGALVYYFWGTPAASEPYLKSLVGTYILIVTFLPKPKKRNGAAGHREFLFIGFVAGAAALTVGAVGPLIAPVFARCGFAKEPLVATKAVCQAILHVVKLPVFIIAGAAGKFASFDFGQLGLLIVLMSVMVIPGTLIGKRMLKSISEQRFLSLYRMALVAAGGKVLIYDGILRLMNP